MTKLKSNQESLKLHYCEHNYNKHTTNIKKNKEKNDQTKMVLHQDV